MTLQEMAACERMNELFSLDAQTGLLTRKVSAGPAKAGEEVGCINSRGYLVTRISGKLVLVHRIIFLMVNRWLPIEVDHISGNRLDNRPENLRAATSGQNRRNAQRRIDNKSGVKGVSWHMPTGKWQAQINANKRRYHLGLFSELEAAAAAVAEARSNLHGEFARHG